MKTKQFVRPIQVMNYLMKLIIIGDHWGNCENKEKCKPCQFMTDVINYLPNLDITDDMIKESINIPDFLKYYEGNPDVTNNMERFTDYINRISPKEDNKVIINHPKEVSSQ